MADDDQNDNLQKYCEYSTVTVALECICQQRLHLREGNQSDSDDPGFILGGYNEALKSFKEQEKKNPELNEKQLKLGIALVKNAASKASIATIIVRVSSIL